MIKTKITTEELDGIINNNYSFLSSNIRSMNYRDDKNLIKVFHTYKTLDSEEILVQDALSNILQYSFSYYDEVFYDDNLVLASKEERFDGKILWERSIRNMPFKEYGVAMKTLINSINKITDNQIMIDEIFCKNIVLTDNMIKVINTDSFKFKQYSMSQEELLIYNLERIIPLFHKLYKRNRLIKHIILENRKIDLLSYDYANYDVFLQKIYDKIYEMCGCEVKNMEEAVKKLRK